jgi:Ser/Thr protein kinase RdoA (MazF antagonist)
VLKILTALQSKEVDYIEAQNLLLDHLIQQGFQVPKIVKTIHGQGHVTEAIGGASHNVRLFEFIPGTIMTDVKPTAALHFQVGEHLARMHVAMQVTNSRCCGSLIF